MKWFAGIGSRKIDLESEEAALMFKAVYQLAKRGFGMTTGGATGCDILCEQAFRLAIEDGYSKENNLKVFIPWLGFNKQKWSDYHIIPEKQITERALKTASLYHPNWNGCRPKARLLHARNVNQVCGEHLDNPVDFVLCWTPDGVEDGKETTYKTGGTGGAIRMATALKIPVFNLYNSDALERLKEHINR